MRSWFNPSSGNLERHLANSHAIYNNQHLVGDWRTGSIYIYDLNYYQDNGGIIKRIRTAQHLSNDRNRTRFHGFEVEIESGVGTGMGQGLTPMAMLKWSDDGGHTYGNERWVEMGPIGGYRYRANWSRMGTARDRVFHFEVTDPVKVAIVQADLQFTVNHG